MDIALNRILHIEFPNTNLGDISAKIESGSASLSEILVSSENIQFGEYNSNKFEVTLYDIPDVSGEKIIAYFECPTPSIPTIAGVAIAGVDVAGSYHTVPTAIVDDTIVDDAIVDNTTESTYREYLFTGYVDSCKLDNLGYYRQIVAYDELAVKRNVSVKDWWNDFWLSDTRRFNGVPLSELRDSVCDYVNIRHTRNHARFNDSLLIKPVVMTVGSLQFANLLQMLCELQCVMPNMTRAGILEFVDLQLANEHSIQNKYEQVNSTFENYTTNTINKLIIEQNGNEVYVSPEPNGTSNIYTIRDNLFLQSASSSELSTFATAYLAYISNLPNYTPASVKMIVSDLSVHLGDMVETDNSTTYVLNNDLSGPLLVEQTIQATGDMYYPETTNENLSEQVFISSEMANTATEIAHEIADTKSAVYYNAVAPEGTDFILNDIWYKTDYDGSVSMYRWDGTQWLLEQFGNEAVHDLSITNAKIADATIQSAKIATIDAGKITTGTLTSRRIDNGNGTFLVTEDGELYALSAHIIGGTIDIDTATSSDDKIKLTYDNYSTLHTPKVFEVVKNKIHRISMGLSENDDPYFQIKDANNTVRLTLYNEDTATNPTGMRVYNATGAQVAYVGHSGSSSQTGGLIYIRNGNTDNNIAQMYRGAYGGMVSVRTPDGYARAGMFSGENGGYFDIYNNSSDNSAVASLTQDTNGGILRIREATATNSQIYIGCTVNGGTIAIYNNDGTLRANLNDWIDLYNYGTRTIRLNGTTGEITCNVGTIANTATLTYTTLGTF